MASFLRRLPLFLLMAGAAMAQTSQIEGMVKGEDGQGLKDALIKIERKDIKGSYKVKTRKKGDYLHAGLPLGTYLVVLEVNGKEVDKVDNVRTRLGENRRGLGRNGADLADRRVPDLDDRERRDTRQRHDMRGRGVDHGHGAALGFGHGRRPAALGQIRL